MELTIILKVISGLKILSRHADVVAYCNMESLFALNQQVEQLYISKGVSTPSSQQLLWDL
jgi:hypothetical protein